MESNSTLINAARQKDALTYNGALTNSTSLNSIVDLFFIMGASREMPEEDIHLLLERAWGADRILTVKSIFHGGDIRGGNGERRFLRIALSWLFTKDKEIFYKIFDLVPEFNRWDSLFHIHTDEVFELVGKNMSNGLLAKWLPRKNQYNGFGRKLRSYLGLSAKQYRKAIVHYTETVEQLMCDKKWADINYSHIPSVAFNKYRKAWYRNDESRFKAFVELAKTTLEKTGETLIKANAIFPYDIYKSYNSGADKKSIDVQWASLPNYMADTNERILPICDVSGSMTGLPMDISVSLGVYISERNKSIFKDAFVTFSERPTIQYLRGTVTDRFAQLERAQWDMNTNLDAVFNLLLGKAIENNLTNDDMPTMLLIISDMEFDSCGRLTAYDNIKAKYEMAGYTIPKIVFWNVNGRKGNVPVSSKTKNVALVSGAGPSTLVAVLKGGEEFTPTSIMLNALDNDRYNVISERLSN